MPIEPATFAARAEQLVRRADARGLVHLMMATLRSQGFGAGIDRAVPCLVTCLSAPATDLHSESVRDP